jgi:type VI secretion system protein ImpK
MDEEAKEFSGKRRLPKVCEEAFLLVLQLRAADDYGDASVLRDRIHQMLDNLERKAKKSEISLEEIQSAKFAIAAFIDETILTSQWSQKDFWLGRTLGFELFNRMDAGEEFFNRLEELRRRSASNIDLLEVFYLCLALGFKGKYLIYEQEKLRFIIDDIYNELKAIRNSSPTRLSPRGDRREQISDVVKKEVPAWIIAVGAAAIGFIFYIIMLLVSTSEANRVLESLR